jgi:hypothetical protein
VEQSCLTCTRLPNPLLCGGWCVPKASLSRLGMAVWGLYLAIPGGMQLRAADLAAGVLLCLRS